VDIAAVAELQVLLEGVPLPAGKPELLEYARRQAATPYQLDALRRLPERRYGYLDAVAETLVRVQPPRGREVPHEPRASSGLPPGGPAYTEPHAESGAVRDAGAARS
jgi:hypothetical protein